MPLALLQADRVNAEELFRRNGSSRASAAELPFLSRTRTGQAFLDLPAPRAISRGSPPELCPATGVAGGPEAPDRATAVKLSLERCLRAVAGKNDICGCRVLALDTVLTVPRDQMSYASGTSARLLSRDLGLDKLLVAEEGRSGDLLLRDLLGPVAVVHRLGGDKVELLLSGSSTERLTGEAVPVGYRRGRIAENITLADAAGHRAHLLIGFSPNELLGRADELIDASSG